ncbi:glucose-6-phosphate isomerase, cytosolic-like [Papaver somniferum]|uniref:glucose-6-phosphate isomerase, cytosolic-like n=1 Tax=Papaver somniferum TaxID=3469 RepID=UPI000E6FF1A9|nr:glucose-6-phosphate isomerase, cytosolic-like [Papaver somniferum]
MFRKTIDGLFLDYSSQCGNQDTMAKLLELAEEAHLKEKIGKMYSGEHINSTEDRSFLHVSLHAPRDAVMSSDGINVVPEIGATGKALKDVVAVGIGSSFLGPLFVHTALQTDSEAVACAKGR